MILKIDGVECCSAFSYESEFKVIWQGHFESWKELHNDEEVVKLVDAAKAKLRRAGGKGKGNGKSNDLSSMPPWRRN
eukprot:1353121-Karenia_brevis.AAC.1